MDLRPLVYIILVNWNNPERTVRTLKSIEKTAYCNYQTLIVDNNSNDNSIELIGLADPEITILRTQSNLGFAGGVNVGIRHALDHHADYIWALNNDLLVDKKTLKEMVALAESDYSIGAVGSILVEEEKGRLEYIRGGGRINFLTGLSRHLQKTGLHDKNLHYLKGASLLLRSAALREIGLFDEKYFLYWEDTDLSFRLRKAGWKLRVAEGARVHHEGYGSMTFKSPLWDYHFTRSSIFFFKRHAAFPPLPITVSVTGRLFFRLLQRKWANIGAIIAATGLGNRPFKSEPIKPEMKAAPARDKEKNIILLDPCSFTPFYDINLGVALARENWQVEWITSEFPFAKIPQPATIKTNKLFFSGFPASLLLKIKYFNNVTFLRRAIKALIYPFEMLRLQTYLKQMTPGILHIQWANLPWLDAYFWKSWQASGWKLVYTVHDTLPLTGTTPKLFLNSGQVLMHLADKVLVHSKNGRQLLMDQGLKENKVAKIPLGPTLTIPPKMIDQSQARQQLKLPFTAQVILFFGFVKPYKGLDILLQSLPIIEKKITQPHLLVAGKLLEPFSRYRAIVNNLPITAKIHWFRDFIPETMLPIYFSAADVVVTPYLQGSSSSIIDLAHQFNKPVVTTSVGGLVEQINDAAGDRLVPSNNVSLLAQGIIDSLNERERNLKTTNDVENPGDDIEEKWTEIATLHGKIYHELLTL